MKYKLTNILLGHETSVTSISSVLNDTEKYLIVSGSRDGTIIVWRIPTFITPDVKPFVYRTLKGHTDLVSGVAITANLKNIISTSWDKTVCIWDIESGECIKTIIGHDSEVMHLRYLEGPPSSITSVSRNGVIMKWDLFSDITPPKFYHSIHEDSITCLDEKPSSVPEKKTCVAGFDGKLYEYSTKHFEQLLLPLKKPFNKKNLRIDDSKDHERSVNHIEYSPDYSLITSGCSNGDVKIWDANELRPICLFSFKAKGSVNHLSFSPTRYQCMAATDQGVFIWDLESKSNITKIFIDDLIEHETDEAHISKLMKSIDIDPKNPWIDNDEYQEKLNYRVVNKITKPLVRPLSITWTGGDKFYVACDDSSVREYSLEPMYMGI